MMNNALLLAFGGINAQYIEEATEEKKRILGASVKRLITFAACIAVILSMTVALSIVISKINNEITNPNSVYVVYRPGDVFVCDNGITFNYVSRDENGLEFVFCNDRSRISDDLEFVVLLDFKTGGYASNKQGAFQGMEGIIRYNVEIEILIDGEKSKNCSIPSDGQEHTVEVVFDPEYASNVSFFEVYLNGEKLYNMIFPHGYSSVKEYLSTKNSD